MVRPKLIPLVVICGPTASGKGGLGRTIAKALDGEIVVADSRKVYRHLDIGTAKPDAKVQQKFCYHLIDLVEPDQNFSAADYVTHADIAIGDIWARQRQPIIVGGTGLYIRSLIWGIIDTPSADATLRAQLLQQEKRNPGCLHHRLQTLDPICAQRLPPTDLMRIIRALEVHILTGKPLSTIQEQHRFATKRYTSWIMAIDWPKDQLDQRIDQRIRNMLEAGWLDEVERLRAQGQQKALKVVGYRQLNSHLQGDCSLEQAITDIQRAHRRYAKQQLTWFRAVDGLHWFTPPLDVDQILNKIGDFLNSNDA